MEAKGSSQFLQESNIAFNSEPGESSPNPEIIFVQELS
jgi:hypothetical protein